MKHSRMLVLLLVLALLSGCQAIPPEPESAPQPPPATVAPTAAPTAVPQQGATGGAAALTANAWQWVSFSSPVEEFKVEKPDAYALTFYEDGTVSIKADCNTGHGTYTADASSLKIVVGPMTRAACPPGSRGDQLVRLLGGAAQYFFADGKLHIDLIADSGTMVFAPAAGAGPGAAAPGDDGAGALAGAFPADVAAQLDAFLQSQVYGEGDNPANTAPGLILLVDTPQSRYLKATGVSSLEKGTPIKPGDRVEIGSISKSFTDVILLQLQEEGVLSLADPLSKWLPELAAKIPNGDKITLQQLAAHTSGIWDYGDPILGEAASNPAKLEQGYTPEELVQYAIKNGKPDFAPGEAWKYSNTGYVLLGMIVEKATGQPLGELYRQRIFEPLGLKTAALIPGVPKPGEIIDGYWWKPDGTRINTTNWNVSQGWAAGGIAMTADELLTYGKALAAGKLFKSPDTLAQMLTFNDQALIGGARFGLGLMDFGHGYWGHAGQTTGFQTLWYTNPNDKITVVGLTNSASYNAFSFLNVISILNGDGAQPFGAATLMPIAEMAPALVPTVWEWSQTVTPAGVMANASGTTLVLARDGSAAVKSDACGEAKGSFTVNAASHITFKLDPSGLTCKGEATAVQLAELLAKADTWRFENGGLVIELTQNGGTLEFQAKP